MALGDQTLKWKVSAVSTVLVFDVDAGVTAVQACPYGYDHPGVSAVEFPIVAGAGGGVIQPSGDNWCWVFREVGDGGHRRFCTVDDSEGEEVDYADLPDVNPVSYSPQGGQPLASWDDTLAILGLAAKLDAARAFPGSVSITYAEGTNNIASRTEDGVTTTYTYNVDNSIASDTRLGVTRLYTYDSESTPRLTGIAVGELPA